LFHPRIQRGISERRNIPQLGVRCIVAKYFFHGALEQRQFDEHRHGLKRFRSHRFPAAFVRRAAGREEERTFLNMMRDPRLVAFPFLKFGFARNRPREERFADGRQRH
jgi:hypothetical protein